MDYTEVIDSRDLIARLEELRSLELLSEDEREELETLAELDDTCPGDWLHGEAFIREDYFTQYCKELVLDCGYISKDFPHWIHICWDTTAENMQADYEEYTLNGWTYYARY